jgi:hypothetical protein
MGPVLRFLGLALDTSSALHWCGLLAYSGAAITSFAWTRRRFAMQWNVQQQTMEDERLRAAMQP